MKNLKIYFGIALTTLLTSLIFLACTKNDEGIINSDNSTGKATLLNKTGAITCYISGATVSNVNTNTASSTVTAGSTTTYQYNSTPAVSNIVWSVVNANPSGSITITGSGATISATFSTAFISGSIQAVGTDSTGQICGPVLPIVKTTAICCVPTFDAFYICGPGAKGAVVPFFYGCNSSTISKIEWNLGGAKWSAGPLAGQSGGTMTPPFTQYSKNIGSYNCNYGKFRITATYYFNNGCPSTTYNLDVIPSN